ncbi:hypothetical protein EK0264_17085 [Epidermidibacterium keratini]|uniref:Uncharacterized protein n=1 Tax=Epidermidibacterium keratini TaxID=1891644 RepID=A0A7L4YS81_9ACTN|nr:hypothetical protein [Epidermidibacterium keratini]QHC01823.1 hypothetical protein EK0264_17085 [Epidermidibacterium keratini]
MDSTGRTVMTILLIALAVCALCWPFLIMIRRRRNGGVEPAHSDFAPWIDGRGTLWQPRIWGENGADYNSLVVDDGPDKQDRLSGRRSTARRRRRRKQ